MGLTYGRAKTPPHGMAQDFGRLILGMDPMDNEKIWDKLHRSTFWGLGNGGIVMSAISAIDIALWDIKGKALGFPAISCWAVRPTRSCGLTPVRFSLTGAREPLPGAAGGIRRSGPQGHSRRVRRREGRPGRLRQPGVWYGHKTYGIMDQKHLRLSVDRLAAVRGGCGAGRGYHCELHAKTDANSAIQFARPLSPSTASITRSPPLR